MEKTKIALALRQIVPILLLLTLSTVFFLLLYFFDNKYTNEAPQAMDGVLFVSEDDWDKYPSRFLWNGWDFYPDQLLTPTSLKQQEPANSLAIGEYSNFSLDDEEHSLHGCATYVLHLVLPDKSHTYAIELPEIFSSYRFYVDDTLITEMGDPDPGSYKEKIQSRVVTFSGSGTVTLLLAVNNQTHYYSGMVYPPSFGEPLALDTQRTLRISVALVLITVICLFAILSSYMFWQTKKREEIFGSFFLLCIATILFFSYPVIHAMIPTAIYPWYTIELASGYFVTALIIIIHNQICHIGRRPYMISTIAALTVCLLIVSYSLMSPYLDHNTAAATSYIIALIKFSAAIYLLMTSMFSAARRVNYVKLLFFADLFYASSLLWDFILPNYEPIIGGWFQEWGAFGLIIALSVILWNSLARGYRNSLILSEKQRQARRQLRLQSDHYQRLSDKIEESRRMRHDFRQHLRTILSLANNKEQLCAYINEISTIDEISEPITLSDNPAIDALVSYYAAMAKKHHIRFESQLAIPAELPLPVVQICTVLGNLLENAVEACNRQTHGDKYICTKARMDEDALYLVMDNSFDGIVHRSKNTFFSRKHTGHGIGLESVQTLVSQYHGVFKILPEGHVFKLKIVLPVQAFEDPKDLNLE